MNIELIPHEVWETKIIPFLHWKDCLNLFQVNKFFRQFRNRKYILMKLIEQLDEDFKKKMLDSLKMTGLYQENILSNLYYLYKTNQPKKRQVPKKSILPSGKRVRYEMKKMYKYRKEIVKNQFEYQDVKPQQTPKIQVNTELEKQMLEKSERAMKELEKSGCQYDQDSFQSNDFEFRQFLDRVKFFNQIEFLKDEILYCKCGGCHPILTRYFRIGDQVIFLRPKGDGFTDRDLSGCPYSPV